MVVNQDARRFEKALEMTSKQLRETNSSNDNKISNGTATMPLTDTTKRLTQVTSPKEGEVDGGLKSQEASAQQMPPPKPPRTMLYEEEQATTSATLAYSSEVTRGTGSPITTSATTSTPKPNCTNPSTFGPTMTTRPSPITANRSMETKTSPSKIPAPVTSTPMVGKSQTHVTFSATVTEIRDSSPASRILNDSNDKGGKKVPPPPPPRRSSRLITQSPQGNGQPKRSFSPPAYENIENFVKLDEDVSGEGNSPQAIINNLNALSQNSNGTSVKGEQQKGRGRPMSKFQQELAAGIYANLNRPDLQGQKLNHAHAVQNASGKEEGNSRNGSDSESTNSSLDSQTGTVLRKAYRQDSPLGDGKVNKDGVKMREGKKVPPPPPVRRSSALSSVQKQTIPEDASAPSKAGNGEQAPLANGEVKSDIITESASVQSIVSHFNTVTTNKNGRGRVNKKYEETEIY